MINMRDIPSRWFALHPTHRLDATYWLTVWDVLFLAGHADPTVCSDDDVRWGIGEADRIFAARGNPHDDGDRQ